MNKVLKAFLCTIVISLSYTPIQAKENNDTTTQKKTILTIAPIIGTDIGGAIPIPISAVGDQMQAFPKLHLTLGAKVFFPVDLKWALAIEVMYKEVEMSANAYVENQKAVLDNQTKYFTGTVKTLMDFNMVEVPIYARYQFGKSKHFLTFGGYGAWCGNANFMNNPQKGYISTRPNHVEDVITAPSEVSNMDFSTLLSRWDAGILLGYENRILPRLALSFRVSMGFKDIFGEIKPLEYNMLQMRGAISVSYDLFSVKSKNKR